MHFPVSIFHAFPFFSSLLRVSWISNGSAGCVFCSPEASLSSLPSWWPRSLEYRTWRWWTTCWMCWWVYSCRSLSSPYSHSRAPKPLWEILRMEGIKMWNGTIIFNIRSKFHLHVYIHVINCSSILQSSSL